MTALGSRHRVTGLAVWLATALGMVTTASAADTPTTAPSSMAIAANLRRFATVGRVLMVAAHPDDENTQLIAYLARGRSLRMAYLSITRGDGGQNVLGPEFGDDLGWVRTQELLAARRLDGGEQFFTRARDFGFSKSPAETLRFWNEPAVLGDVVRVIRTFRPDVIVTRFGPTQTNTHGHHTASAILAVQAFKLAADPTAYPEQLKTLSVWQAKRIVQNAGGPAGGGKGSLRLNIGGDDPVLGLSYGQIAARSRAMHKSQGFGNFAAAGRGGNRTETFTLLGGEPATTDLMDGVDTTWNAIPGGGAVAAMIADVIANFAPTNPAKGVPALVEIKKVIRGLPTGPVVDEKNAVLDRIILDCLGVSVRTTVRSAEVTPGETVTLTNTVTVRGTGPVRLTAITAAGVVDDGPRDAAAGRPLVRELDVLIDGRRGVTQPYWLREPGTAGMYAVADADLIGRPENPPAIPVTFAFDVAGVAVHVVTEPVQADDGRRIEVVAPVSLAFDFGVRLFKPGVPRQVKLTVTTHRPGVKATLRLIAPAGWGVEPAEQPIDGGATFTVTPPAGAAAADLRAVATVDGVTYDTGRKEIRYPHLPPLLLQPVAKLRAVSLDLRIAGRTVGYLPGAGDDVADCLREMGYAVTILTGDDLDAGKLKRFDTVVTGVRAFNVRRDLSTGATALFDYAAAGGTVVVQYNRPDDLVAQPGPYPLKVSGSRITDETATMTFLAPQHPALNVPNKITADDFGAWVQERGVYFPTQWDAHWQPILGGSDPGEPPLAGGLLVAPYGKGTVAYTGLVFFRELPAGVPGAYRLFANLVSLGHS